MYFGGERGIRTPSDQRFIAESVGLKPYEL